MARNLALFVLVAASIACAQAWYSGCRFRFCDNSLVVVLGKHTDVAITGPICDKYGKHIGVLNSGEARLVRRNRRGYTYFTKISNWTPKYLKQNFSPSFFKTFTIRRLRYRYRNGQKIPYYVYMPYSGLGRERYQQNQNNFLHKKRFVLPIRSWQVLNGKRNVVANVHNYNPYYHCIAFQSRLY